MAKFLDRIYLEVLEGFEGFTANLTGKISNRVVDIAHVARSLLVRSEGFAAFVTLKRMFPSVDSHVHF